MLGIAGNLLERLGCGFEQKAVDDFLVLVGDGGNLLRQCEDHMKVLDRQQIGLARFQPRPGGRALAGGAMTVPTTGVGDLLVPARLALPDVAPERRRTAGLDRPHHAPLATIEVTGIGLAIGLTVAAAHIRHLQRGASHARCVSPGKCSYLKKAEQSDLVMNDRARSPAMAVLTRGARKVLAVIEAQIGDKSSVAISQLDFVFTHRVNHRTVTRALPLSTDLGPIEVEAGRQRIRVFRVSRRWSGVNAADARAALARVKANGRSAPGDKGRPAVTAHS